MEPQFIKTEAGDDLVVMTRRAYDALLASQGDEAAEDRAVARMAEDYLAGKAAGRETSIPHWFVKLVAEHGSSVTAARKHLSCTQAELARVLAISQGHLSDIERGRRSLTQTQRQQVAAYTRVGVEWLA